MKGIRATLFLLIFLLSPALSYGGPSYEGKTLTIVVGFKPGGGYDRTARLVAGYLPKYLPGNPKVVIQNIPGANSISAANHLYHVAKPDGLTIGTFNRNLTFAQLIKVEGVKFDLTKFAWIGSAASETTVLTIRSDLPYKTFEDLRKANRAIVVGASGPGSTSHDFPQLLEEFTGVNFKIVTGYNSSADMVRALERKEVEALASAYSSLKPYIDQGLVRPLLRSRTWAPEIEKLPVDEDLASSAKGKSILRLLAASERIGRPYVAPPGTPPDAMKVLQGAFAKVASDKELLAEAGKAKMPIEYVGAEESLKVVYEVLNQHPKMVEEITKYIRFAD